SVSLVAGAGRLSCDTRPKVRMPAILPLRATATCTDGRSPSRTSRSARAKRASSFAGSMPTCAGDSAKKCGAGMRAVSHETSRAGKTALGDAELRRSFGGELARDLREARVRQPDAAE